MLCKYSRMCVCLLGPVVGMFLAHYASAHLYVRLCTPLTVQGVIQSVFMTASPVCVSMLTLMTWTQNIYSNIITGFIVWLVRTRPAPLTQ